MGIPRKETHDVLGNMPLQPATWMSPQEDAAIRRKPTRKLISQSSGMDFGFAAGVELRPRSNLVCLDPILAQKPATTIDMTWKNHSRERYDPRGCEFV